MKKAVGALIVSLTVMMVIVALPETAEGRHGRGRVFVSGEGFSFVFGSPAIPPGFIGIPPSRSRFGRHGNFRRGHGGTSLFLRFGSRYDSYGGGRSYGRHYGHYPRYRYRSYDRGLGYGPYRSRRVWIPGRNHDGRYRPGRWEHRDLYEDRHDERGGRVRDRRDSRHSDGRDRY